MNRNNVSLGAVLSVTLLFALSGCLSGEKPPARLTPEISKRITHIPPLPISVGIYIEPDLRKFVQEVWLRHYLIGIHRFEFPIGESLSSNIIKMSEIIFKDAVMLETLPQKGPEGLDLDGILTVGLIDSQIELKIEEAIWWAVGKHKLSINISFLDKELNKILESKIMAESKGLDFISSKVEYEWWVTTGPNFAPAVNDTIKAITYNLSREIVASKEILDYIGAMGRKAPGYSTN